MAIKAPNPDRPCQHCGERPELTLHEDGSIRSAFHNCKPPLPGPGTHPMFYRQGEYQPNPGAKIKRVLKWNRGLAVSENEKSVKIIIPTFDTNDRAPRSQGEAREYLNTLQRIAAMNMTDLVAVPWEWLQDANLKEV